MKRSTPINVFIGLLWALVIAYVSTIIVLYASFVVEHHRFPAGLGELYNWGFGL